MTSRMEKNFVTFMSPGTFFAETTTKEIDTWDVELAKKMAEKIVERYNARPYGFYFSTRAREDDELDSKTVKTSNRYYIAENGKVETIEEIEARNDPDEEILRANMRGNGYERVFTTTKGWKATLPIEEGDMLV